MPIEPHCNQCLEEINPSAGYLFYSPDSDVRPGGPKLVEIGCLLLCQGCCDRIIRKENWEADRKMECFLAESRVLVAVENAKEHGSTPAILAEFTQRVRELKFWSILDQCRARELTLEEAKAKSRELAQHWWEDRKKGEAAAEEFWSVRSTEPEASGCFGVVLLGLVGLLIATRLI